MEGWNIADHIDIARNALMLAGLCGAASPFATYLSSVLSLSERMNRMAIEFLLVPFVACMLAAVMSGYSVPAGHGMFTAACVSLGAAVLAFVLVGLIVSIFSDAGLTSAGMETPAIKPAHSANVAKAELKVSGTFRELKVSGIFVEEAGGDLQSQRGDRSLVH